MTGRAAANEPPSTKEDPETLVLRGRPRPVARFRRGLIVAITAIVAATLVLLSWLALEPPSLRQVGQAAAPDGIAMNAPADALAGAPRTYGDVPRLGPPLPGDLGRPILKHERSLGAPGGERFQTTEPEGSLSARLAEGDRRTAAETAAHASGVLVQLGQGEAQPREPLPAIEPARAPPPPEPASAPPPGSASAQQKLEFVRAAGGDVNPDPRRPPLARFVLAAGTVIPASLITGINSDLPGVVIAQVTEDVRDSASGTRTLIPQGARLVGRYDSIVAFGQRRALLVWNRIVFPDSSSLDVDHLPATDTSGYAGLRDAIDLHTWQLLKGIGLSTLLGVGAELSLGRRESDLVRAVREAAQQSGANAGAQIISHELEVQPTISIRPGWPVRAILDKDLALPAYN